MTVRTLRAAARWMRVIVRNWRKLTKKSCRRSLNAINSCNILKMLYSVFRRRTRLYKSINSLTERIYSALPASRQGNRMEFLCSLCPRRNIYHYAYYQHMHIEHRRYECEICRELLPSRKSYKTHQSQSHVRQEHDMIEERWKWEKEFEKKVFHETHVKSMISDAGNRLNAVEKLVRGISTELYGDIGDHIDECAGPLFHKLQEVIEKIQFEEDALSYYVDIEGTVTSFAAGVKVYPPPKYRANLTLRPAARKKCELEQREVEEEKEETDKME